MSRQLIEKIRQARQQTVDCGKFRFVVRRPTDLEMSKLRGVIDQEILFRRFVVDWQGVTGLDIHGGGTADPLPFDTDLFVEWIADRPQLWPPITDAIVEAYRAHEARLEQDAKN